jgi:hypothetical protein
MKDRGEKILELKHRNAGMIDRFHNEILTYWQTSVIEENISLLEFTKDSLLLILFDRVADLISSNLVFFPE